MGDDNPQKGTRVIPESDPPILHALDGLFINVWSTRRLVAIEYGNVWLHFTATDALRVAGLLIAAADHLIDKQKTERN
jgi:hypothetical protein